MKPVTEKRSFYRIEDLVGLSCSLIEGDASPAEQGSGVTNALGGGLFAEIDREFNRVTNILWQENPVIAQALGLLNQKISTLAASALPDSDERGHMHEESMVSLSGSGIGFHSTDHFPEGARLRLSLSLRPSNIGLTVTGIVKGCEPSPESPGHSYWVRVNFEEGNEAAQEQLIQHVVQRQCAQIQERTAGSSSEEDGAL